jgi:hypothetical protein
VDNTHNLALKGTRRFEKWKYRPSLTPKNTIKYKLEEAHSGLAAWGFLKLELNPVWLKIPFCLEWSIGNHVTTRNQKASRRFL